MAGSPLRRQRKLGLRDEGGSVISFPRMPRVADLPPGWRCWSPAEKVKHLLGMTLDERRTSCRGELQSSTRSVSRCNQALKSLATHKTGRNDLRGLAHLARTGFFKPVHVKSLPAHAVRSLIIARKNLIGQGGWNSGRWVATSPARAARSASSSCA
jgi:hypothetical protein